VVQAVWTKDWLVQSLDRAPDHRSGLVQVRRPGDGWTMTALVQASGPAVPLWQPCLRRVELLKH
jgi:hypothetical protein